MYIDKTNKLATIIFEGNDYFTCEINNVRGTYHWTINDVQLLRDRIESTGVEVVNYFGVEGDCPMTIDRVNELSARLAVMV